MPSATITSKGQITIPVGIRTALGLATGDRVNFVLEGESVRFLPVTKDISSLKGMLAKPKSPISIEDMKATIKSKAGKV